MITLRKANERGRTHIDWLDSRHTFAFGHYHDTNHTGFGTHPHRDMEILSLVLEGEMQHRDSIGNGSLVRAGELQKMSAGSGVTHSEFNASDTEPLHFYQIWIEPERRGIAPEYEQIALNGHRTTPGLHLIAGRHAPAGAITLHQDASLFLGRIEPGGSLPHAIAPERHAWIQVIEGDLWINGAELHDADGAAISNESPLELASARGARFLLFDLA
jgi:hypothetical protein